ncbi:DUF6691 family protein [Lamprobacter modestohalophilus]|nr:DUF6691 family protein [Lamprobacter modestohalophilus]MEA1053404.1 DUF6691 family protein [Lamprobacter modestohalophilus]
MVARGCSRWKASHPSCQRSAAPGRRRTIRHRLGSGRGLVGLCPGPAMTALVSGHPEALIFFTAMLTGMYAHRTVDQLAENRTPTGSMSDG